MHSQYDDTAHHSGYTHDRYRSVLNMVTMSTTLRVCYSKVWPTVISKIRGISLEDVSGKFPFSS